MPASNQEILTKAIEKAIANGWQEPSGNELQVDEKGQLFVFIKDSSIRGYGYQFNVEELIYSHDFAKALWGEHELKPPEYIRERKYFTIPATGDKVHEINLDKVAYDMSSGGWQYHLQQMIVAPDPIKYLGENL